MAPEREMIRRISPFALPLAIAAFALGTLVDGTDAGWSAAAREFNVLCLLDDLDRLGLRLSGEV